jgi:hypothetical protein
MIIYAFFVCTVLAMIRRKERKDQIKYGIILFSIMVAGSILFGWLMYLFF